MHSHAVSLDPDLRCADAIEFENDLRERFIGQEEATATTVRMIQTYMAGMNNPDQPAGILLALGPTGTGKTRSLRPASPKNLARRSRHSRFRTEFHPLTTRKHPNVAHYSKPNRATTPFSR